MYVSLPPTPAAGTPAPSSAAGRDSAFGQMYRMATDLHQLIEERQRQHEALARAHQQALLRLAIAAEYKDGDTGVHIMRLGQLSGRLALELTGDRTFAEQLCRSAPMHDVGKIGIPDAVLKKTGPLAPDEWAVMRSHPAIGASILGGAGHPLFSLAAEVALHHHERFDGSGYPGGLAGESISLAGRIVAVVDVYDALTMDRCYRPRLPEAQVLQMMRAASGSHFDPRVLDAFLGALPDLRELKAEIDARGDLGLADAGVSVFDPLF